MRRTLLGIPAALLLLAVPATAARAQQSAVPSPGAPGIGDPYFPTDGNGGYDVSHYAIAVDYQASTRVLTGRTTITATSDQALSRFDLDLTGLTVQSIDVDGRPASWTRTDPHELVVTPAEPIADHHGFTVTVAYRGEPRELHDPEIGIEGFVPTPDGDIVAGEPHVATTWFPVNDHPLDKATYDIAITVPRGLQALSNGRLVSERTVGGRTTWSWSETEPMASYLATATTGHFKIHHYSSGGLDYLDAIDPRLFKERGHSGGGGLHPTIGENAQRALSKEPEIIRWESGIFGPYPFGQAGGIVDKDPGIGFALENQTRPIHASGFFTEPRADNDSVIVHELAHQWYGDSLSVGRWQDIWLNEGFASYAEWLWSEHKGRGTAQQIFESIASIPAASRFWKLEIGDPGRYQLFESPVYARGAMTLHALRHRIGDDDFFRLLRQWATVHAGGNVTTPQFIALAESISGQDLDGFFHTWLYRGAKPEGLPGSGSPQASARWIAPRHSASRAGAHD